VIEVLVPELQRLPPGETVPAFTVVSQGLISHHHWVVDGQPESRSVPFRYVWPSELDLMARLRRNEPAPALEQLDPCALHEQQLAARVGLGEDGVAAATPRRVAPTGFEPALPP
jgi:hypothetical protein